MAVDATDQRTHRHKQSATDQRGKKTRPHILEIARQTLNEVGVNATNCRLVSKCAGLTPANIYYYFPNMDAILKELNQSLIRESKESVEAISKNPMDQAGRRIAALEWLNIVWTWRYAFLDLHILYRRDPELREKITGLQDLSIAHQEKSLVNHMTSIGMELTEADKVLCHDIAVNSVIVANNWLRYVTERSEEGSLNREDFLSTVDQFLTTGRTFYNLDFLKRVVSTES